MINSARFREFITRLSALVDRNARDEARILDEGGALLAELVRHDDWLPAEYARESRESYRQYLLHCDSRERFSVVSFVWGPGQRTPVHDHTVWGLIGMLRGAELCEEYAAPVAGQPMRKTGEHRLVPGEIDRVSPTVGDIHVVSNALPDRPSISIHAYGANIGAVARHIYDPLTGTASGFVSGYSNAELPNIWDRSDEIRARIAG